MNEEKLKKNVSFSCDKHEIRGKDREVIEEWMRIRLIEYGILESIAKGTIEVCGVKENEPLFRLTNKGLKTIEKLIKEQ